MSIAGLNVRCNLFDSLYGFVLLMACTCAIKLIWHLQMNGDIVCVFTHHKNIFECVCTVWMQMQYCLNRIGLFEHWCLVECVNCNKTTTTTKTKKHERVMVFGLMLNVFTFDKSTNVMHLRYSAYQFVCTRRKCCLDVISSSVNTDCG